MSRRNPTNIYHQGAIDGLYLGVYFSVMFLLQTGASSFSPLMLLGQLMMLSVPIVAFFILRKGYKATNCTSTFSGIWLHGIGMFIGGSLILGICSYLYMRFVNPAYIHQMFLNTAEIYRSINDPGAQDMAEFIDGMVETHNMPTPISLSMALMWLGCFSGAILSLILAGLVKAFTRKKDEESK